MSNPKLEKLTDRLSLLLADASGQSGLGELFLPDAYRIVVHGPANKEEAELLAAAREGGK